MMYVQQMDKLPIGTVDKLQEIIENKLRPKQWAYIVHDKDTDEKGQPSPCSIPCSTDSKLSAKILPDNYGRKQLSTKYGRKTWREIEK